MKFLVALTSLSFCFLNDFLITKVLVLKIIQRQNQLQKANSGLLKISPKSSCLDMVDSLSVYYMNFMFLLSSSVNLVQ